MDCERCGKKTNSIYEPLSIGGPKTCRSCCEGYFKVLRKLQLRYFKGRRREARMEIAGSL